MSIEKGNFLLILLYIFENVLAVYSFLAKQLQLWILQNKLGSDIALSFYILEHLKKSINIWCLGTFYTGNSDKFGMSNFNNINASKKKKKN